MAFLISVGDLQPPSSVPLYPSPTGVGTWPLHLQLIPGLGGIVGKSSPAKSTVMEPRGLGEL